jgi:hypothetical protein
MEAINLVCENFGIKHSMERLEVPLRHPQHRIGLLNVGHG